MDLSTIFTDINGDILFRVLLSLILGFIIGLEREITNKSAGLRTNILVCVGSCLFTILSIFGFSNALSIYPMGDPARVAAQILTGIGFIGAGTVLRHGTSIYGLTTAATLWITASIGMACGCGKFGLSIVCSVLSLTILILIRIFERNCISKNRKNNHSLLITINYIREDQDNICQFITNTFCDMTEFSQHIVNIDKKEIEINFQIDCCSKNAIDDIMKKLDKNKQINSISIKELSD